MKIKNSKSYHNNNKRHDDTFYKRLDHHILFDHEYYNGIGKNRAARNKNKQHSK